MVDRASLQRRQRVVTASREQYWSDVAARNGEIWEADRAGWLLADIAAATGLTEMMVSKILTKRARQEAAREGAT